MECQLLRWRRPPFMKHVLLWRRQLLRWRNPPFLEVLLPGAGPLTRHQHAGALQSVQPRVPLLLLRVLQRLLLRVMLLQMNSGSARRRP